MNVDSAPIFDSDGNMAGTLDLAGARWQHTDGDGENIEVAFVPHTDGVTYIVMGYSAQPDGPVLVYTPTEWDAFLKGATAGQFRPQT